MTTLNTKNTKMTFLALTGLMTIWLITTPAQAAQICVDDSTADQVADAGDCSETCGSGCSILDAVAKANMGSGDWIIFDPSISSIILDLAIDNITEDLIITGPGSDSLTIDGNGNGRVFTIEGAVIDVTIAGLTITGGDGGIDILDFGNTLRVEDCEISGNDSGAEAGGGIRNVGGNLAILNSTISGNQTDDNGGGILNDGGSVTTIFGTTISSNTAMSRSGGIHNIGGSILTIENSTLFDNEAGLNAGAINNRDDNSALLIMNSTISGNRAKGQAGGIDVEGDTNNIVTLSNVTITENLADSDSNGGTGGGIAIENGTGNNVTMKNTIIAGNMSNDSDPDCNTSVGIGGNLVSLGNNILGDNTGCDDNDLDTDPLTKNDQVGDVVGSGDPADAIDPLLAALTPADGGDPANGSPTGVHVPLDMSPVIDAVDEAIAPAEDKDQLGTDRPQGSAPDIGAVEATCGDGEAQGDEDCDDGNTEDSDDCSNACVDQSGSGDGNGGCTLTHATTPNNANALGLLLAASVALFGWRRFRTRRLSKVA